MNTMQYDWRKGLPESYVKVLEEFNYGTDDMGDITVKELIYIWRAAIKALKESPGRYPTIAIESFSVGSYCPAAEDEPEFEYIHECFGDMEIGEYDETLPPIADGEDFPWSGVEDAIEKLAAKYGV
jgi:hypothetical protein